MARTRTAKPIPRLLSDQRPDQRAASAAVSRTQTAARFYDQVVEPLNAPPRDAARRFHPAPAGSVVLDLGCGTGAALADYRDLACTVMGADPSPAMLQRARARRARQLNFG
jgi:predicted TPR repeat methyltransferase